MSRSDVNPLTDPSPGAWDRLIESIGLPSLLVLIESRMSPELRARVESADILQETLLHVWRDRHKVEWRGMRACRSWVITVADHRITEAAARLDAIKRGGDAHHVPLCGTGEHGAPDEALARTTTPGRMAVYREQAAAMRAALDALPEEWREVVRLRVFALLSLAAIAGALGIGESAVRHRLRKGGEMYARVLRTQLASKASVWATQSDSMSAGFAALALRDPSP
jgi:RNA polymerase sigma factor (sigma-70 family)